MLTSHATIMHSGLLMLSSHATIMQSILPAHDDNNDVALQFWRAMLDAICAPITSIRLRKRLTMGPDLDQLPQAIWAKVQADEAIDLQERALVESRVEPIRQAMQVLMKRVLIDYLVAARLDLIAADLGLIIQHWGPEMMVTEDAIPDSGLSTELHER